MAAGCQATERTAPPEPTRAEAEAQARPAVLPPPEPMPPGSPELGVEVGFVAVAPLYRGFFGDRQARSTLGRALAGKVTDPAKLAIAYDNDTRIGTIQLELAPQGILSPVARSGDTIQLAGLAPITTALASYRSDLASRFDVRIDNFRVRLFSVRGFTACLFDVTGDAPPDGRTLSPCVTIGGLEHCGQSSDEGVTFTHEVAQDVATCLDL